MPNLFWSGILLLLTLTACGSGTPTRQNDFIPLTSMVIVAAPSRIAANTSTRLTVIGNFSGQFTRDITDQVVFTSATPTVAVFKIPEIPSRVTGLAPGAANLTATYKAVFAECSAAGDAE